jgi:CheY-like chemotaxis protein
MRNLQNLVVFSDNRETKGTYIALANSFTIVPNFRDKNKTSLQVLAEQRPDVILLEISQPVMSEIEFVDQIHGLAGGVPIIILSSYFFDTKDIVFGDKMAAFITKPFTLQHVLDAITALPDGENEFEAVVPPPSKEAKVDQIIHEHKKLSVLLEISRNLNSITDFGELLHRIIVLAADTLQAERATLFLVDKDRTHLWSRTGIGIEKQEIRIPIETGIAGEVALSGVPQIISDPYSHPKFNKEVDIKTGFRTRNMMCLPMKNIEGTIIGVFQILNKIEGDFTNEDQYFLSAMAANTGIAIENALLHDEIKNQLAEVKRSYDELYIAQNQILKESKIVTFSEVVNFFKKAMENSAAIGQAAMAVKKAHTGDAELQKKMDIVLTAYRQLMQDTDTYFRTKKEELNYRF